MQPRHKRFAILSALAASMGLTVHAQAVLVNSTWNGGGASWQDASQWTPNAQFPNNGNGGDTYNATVNAGLATLNADVTLENLVLTNGGISLNNNMLLINQIFGWTGGTLAGPGTVEAVGGMQIAGAADKFINNSLMTNNTAVTLDGAGALRGVAASYENNVGGTFDILSDASILQSGGAFDYVNKGKFRKAGGAGTSTVSAVVNNTGSVEARSGTLSLTQAPTQVAGNTLTGGTWIAAGATLEIQGVSLDTLGAGTVVTLDGVSSTFAAVNGVSDNQGEINVLNGAIYTNTAPTLTNQNLITLDDGRLNGNALINDLTIQGLGGDDRIDVASLTNNGLLDLGLGNNTLNVTNTLNNGGMATLTNTGGTIGDIDNQFLATLDVVGGNLNVTGISNDGQVSITNSTVTGSGHVSNDTGATLTIDQSTLNANSLSNDGDMEVKNGSDVQVTNQLVNDVNGKLDITDSTVHSNTMTNDGQVRVHQPGGILIVDGTLLNNGLLVVDGMAQATMIDNSAQLRGGGMLNADVLNAGLLAPGPDGSGTDILAIQGGLTLSPAGTLEIELAGMTPGTEHDQVIVEGLATLGGALQVINLPGLVLNPGDMFTILMADQINGSFADLLLPTNGQGQPLFDVVIDQTTVKLVTRRNEPPPGDGTIPEPATFALLGLSAAGLIRRRRR